MTDWSEVSAQGRYGEILLEFHELNPHLTLAQSQEQLDRGIKAVLEGNTNTNGKGSYNGRTELQD